MPLIAKIICVKNVRPFVFWGFLIKQLKKYYAEKIVEAVWELPANPIQPIPII